MPEENTNNNEPKSAEALRSTDLLALSQKWKEIAAEADEKALKLLDKDPRDEVGISNEQAARTFRHCANALDSLANA